MGLAMCRRLREQGHNLVVWNRTEAKATSFVAEPFPGSCTAAPTASAALDKGSESDLVIVCLSDTPTVKALLADPSISSRLRGKTVANLTSGSPDDGRVRRRLEVTVLRCCAAVALRTDGLVRTDRRRLLASCARACLGSAGTSTAPSVARLPRRAAE